MPPFQSFRQRVARAFGRTNKSAGIAQILRMVAGHNDSTWPRLDVYDQQTNEYLRSSWVYIAVTRTAEAAALVPYEVYTTTGEVLLPNHPVNQLLRAPNPFTSQFDLIESTFGYLELTGNAYWFLAGPPGGVPTEIWPLRPDRMRVVPDSARYIGGYVYTVDGVDIPLAAEEVIHFKRFHPTSDLYGLSALEAAAVASQSDRAMAQWNRNFFSGDKGVPAGIVTIKNMVDDASYERIQREWRESYGGTQRKTAFLRGTDIAWSDIGLSQKDSDFLASRQFSKHEILHIWSLTLRASRTTS
jgi:HK97 family phage portal protein